MTVTPHRDQRGWYELQGAVTEAAVEALGSVGHLDRLSVTKGPRLTVESAKLVRKLHSVGWLRVWCEVTRAALCHLIRIPRLEVLDVLSVRPPGRLDGFERATSLHTLRVNLCLIEDDLLSISRCQALRELAIQSSELTLRAMQSLLALPRIESIDLEATPFDDEMAEMISRSETLRSIDLGATRLTRRGLVDLVSMRQLRSLDLWATQLIQDDLELLRALPALEYLSVGGCDASPPLDGARLVALLLELPSLKRVWLDGVAIDAGQVARLEQRLESVRVTR
jgi:hypothetical protein